MQKCSQCGVLKEDSAFGKDAQKKTGLRPQCKLCRSIQRMIQYALNPEPHKERTAAFRKAHPGYGREAMNKWYMNNKPLAFERAKKWSDDNPAKRAEISMRRRAKQLTATPAWANIKKIQAFYELARQLSIVTGIKYNVDHIIPLLGKKVSGLHVENNLQILEAVANIKKGNKYDV